MDNEPRSPRQRVRPTRRKRAHTQARVFRRRETEGVLFWGIEGLLDGCSFDSRRLQGTATRSQGSDAGLGDCFCAGVAKDSGHGSVAARSRAEEAIVRIEGSLILARVLGDTAGFERVLKLLPDILTAA